jgi:hypothetical protein
MAGPNKRAQVAGLWLAWIETLDTSNLLETFVLFGIRQYEHSSGAVPGLSCSLHVR